MPGTFYAVSKLTINQLKTAGSIGISAPFSPTV